MAEYPIIMKQKNDQGDYDILYPKTLGSQVEGMTFEQITGNLPTNRLKGNIPSSQVTGTFPSSQITGQFPSSQIDGIYTDEETLTSVVAQLFNLSGSQVLPNNVFNILSKAMLYNTTNNTITLPNGTTVNLSNAGYGNCNFEYGSYKGTGNNGSSDPNSLTFNFEPKIIFIIPDLEDITSVRIGLFAKLTSDETEFYLNGIIIEEVNGNELEVQLVNVKFNGNEVIWYSTYNASRQLNNSNTNYYYFAFG